ncbi:MAG: hypothetical protein U5N56_10145 [Candidatus Marinimicrobia bacterium]|nr:hypothetical protein [Candidatus Neomarinimicrobiota bacterium]
MQCGIQNSECKALKIVGWTVLGIALAFLFGLVIKLLWNALMPEIFGLSEIGYWQGVGLFILARILFGGMPHGSGENKKSPASDAKEAQPVEEKSDE